MNTYKEFEDIILESQGRRVVIEWIGEGLSGDFDPEDENDTQILRFYCDQLDESDEYEPNWVPIEDTSCATSLDVNTPRIILLAYMNEILSVIINGENVKTELAKLTHYDIKDITKLIPINLK